MAKFSKICKCGCGESFQTDIKSQEFVNGSHRNRYFYQRKINNKVCTPRKRNVVKLKNGLSVNNSIFGQLMQGLA